MRTASCCCIAALLILASPAWGTPARQAWNLRHQPDRFKDRVIMSAFADADHGPARLSLYCDTDNGFRAFLSPHQMLIPEGPTHLSVRIDGGTPVSLSGNAFGDSTTDVITITNTGPIQAALAGARHVTIHYTGGGGASGTMAFTFTGLAAGEPKVMTICPVRQPRPR